MSRHSRRGAAWERRRLAVLAAADFLCARCGATATEVHHRRRRADGGDDDDNNLEAICRACHIRHHRPPRWGHGWAAVLDPAGESDLT